MARLTTGNGWRGIHHVDNLLPGGGIATIIGGGPQAGDGIAAGGARDRLGRMKMEAGPQLSGGGQKGWGAAGTGLLQFDGQVIAALRSPEGVVHLVMVWGAGLVFPLSVENVLINEPVRYIDQPGIVVRIAEVGEQDPLVIWMVALPDEAGS